MKYLFSCILLTMYVFVGYAANTVKVIAIDSESRDTLRGVEVSFSGEMIAESRDNGDIEIDLTNLNKSDELKFKALGYRDVIILTRNLKPNGIVEMPLISMFIEEITVSSTSKESKDLYDKLISANSKRHKSEKNMARYVASGHFAKLVEANNYTIMSRDEYGVYFTSGTTKLKDKFDTSDVSDFIAQYGARSYDLTSDGTEQIDEMFRYGAGEVYEANSMNTFYVMRHISLFGPILSGDKNFNYEFLGYDGNIGSIKFESKENSYPEKTPLIAVGILRFNRETYKVIDIDMQKLFLVNQTVKKPTLRFDFEYSAYLKVDYDPNGVFYFKDCDLTLRWGSINVEGARYLLKPARPYPHLNKLVEKEYWRCGRLEVVAKEYSENNDVWLALMNASWIGAGIYDPDFFKNREFPMKSSDNFAKLKAICPLDSMYIETSLTPDRYNHKIRTEILPKAKVWKKQILNDYKYE